MPADPTFPIDVLLVEMGFVRVASKQAARRALIEAGLTNERKQNMAEAKREAAVEAIEARIARVCAAEACRNALDLSGPPGATAPRRVVEVTPEACEVCGGSDIARNLQRMTQDLVAAGRTHLLVVGGSPNARTALKTALRGTPVELTLVEGDRATGAKRARELAESADVIVIWANTQLSHKVSMPFQNVAPERTFTCARRSVAALADEVSRHIGSGRARGGQASKGTRRG